jgi:translation elongation factor EF-1beta
MPEGPEVETESLHESIREELEGEQEALPLAAALAGE